MLGPKAKATTLRFLLSQHPTFRHPFSVIYYTQHTTPKCGSLEQHQPFSCSPFCTMDGTQWWQLVFPSCTVGWGSLTGAGEPEMTSSTGPVVQQKLKLPSLGPKQEYPHFCLVLLTKASNRGCQEGKETLPLSSKHGEKWRNCWWASTTWPQPTSLETSPQNRQRSWSILPRTSII